MELVVPPGQDMATKEYVLRTLLVALVHLGILGLFAGVVGLSIAG